ncbi:MAG TPA: Co2+/Mg2+ efflux protein ApaG [Anaeromyxobacteraceae bacterium]|nr:Co2+/Mg2+ efflux protein ApaG [Anaeromyxobacteraceae bacterium]
MSEAVTQGVRVTVRSDFRADRSLPAQGRYLFTYTVRVRNEGTAAAKLLSRHWIITDAGGEREEVVGDGVVGKQPHLEPGGSFEYTSFCVLKTPIGQMRGTYTMMRDDGTTFLAEIAPFTLAVPSALN